MSRRGLLSALDGDVLAVACEGGMERSDLRFVATIGLKDIVVIASGDSVLVIHKDRTQRVKEEVTRLKKNDRWDLL
jgi:mannose-1-phosphate guanylyltransferase / mannose-6-phosphate isomerase